MAVTDQLSAPNANQYVMGRFSLHRYVRCEATAATPVVWTNMQGIVSVDVGEPSWDLEADIFQQGAGDNKTHIKRGPRWPVTITCLPNKFGDILAQIYGVTWGASHAAISLRSDDDVPQIIIESICRDSDNSTHLFSRVIQDFIVDDQGHASPMDYAEATISGHTYHEPFLLYTGYEMIYDRWAATPATATYSTSCGTPVDLLTSSDHDDWHFDNMVFCKVKDNSAGDTIGKRVTSGVALSGGTLTFTTGTPAASDQVSVLYAKAS